MAPRGSASASASAAAASAAAARVDDLAVDLARAREALRKSDDMRTRMREALTTLKLAYEEATRRRATALPRDVAAVVANAKREASEERLRRMKAEAKCEEVMKSAPRGVVSKCVECESARARASELAAECARLRAKASSGEDHANAAKEKANAAKEKANAAKEKANASARALGRDGRSATAPRVGASERRSDERDGGDDARASARASDSDVGIALARATKKRARNALAGAGDGAGTGKRGTPASDGRARERARELSMPCEGERWVERPPPPLAPLAMNRVAVSSARASAMAPVTMSVANGGAVRPRARMKSSALLAIKAHAEKTKRAFSAPK